jgi:hypothetical protein
MLQPPLHGVAQLADVYNIQTDTPHAEVILASQSSVATMHAKRIGKRDRMNRHTK